MLDEIENHGEQLARLTWFWQHALEGRYVEALELLPDTSWEPMSWDELYYPEDLLRAMAYQALGREGDARSAYAGALVQLENAPRHDDARFHAALAVSYAGLGRKREARKAGLRAGETASNDALVLVLTEIDLAWSEVLLDDKATARRQLDDLLSRPAPIAAAQVRVDPRWTAVRGSHPGAPSAP